MTLKGKTDRSTDCVTGALGENLVKELFERIFAEELTRITDVTDQCELGDLRTPTGHTIEVKSQQVGHHSTNFVEVCQWWREYEPKPYHQGAMGRLASILSLPSDAIANKQVTSYVCKRNNCSDPQHGCWDTNFTLGSIPDGTLNISIKPFNNATLLTYINTDFLNEHRDGGKKGGSQSLVMVYEAKQMLSLLRKKMLSQGNLFNNVGVACHGTMGFFGVPYPPHVYLRTVNVTGSQWEPVHKENNLWVPFTDVDKGRQQVEWLCEKVDGVSPYPL
jgi:hypothetical protein